MASSKIGRDVHNLLKGCGLERLVGAGDFTDEAKAKLRAATTKLHKAGFTQQEAAYHLQDEIEALKIKLDKIGKSSAGLYGLIPENKERKARKQIALREFETELDAKIATLIRSKNPMYAPRAAPSTARDERGINKMYAERLQEAERVRADKAAAEYQAQLDAVSAAERALVEKAQRKAARAAAREEAARRKQLQEDFMNSHMGRAGMNEELDDMEGYGRRKLTGCGPRRKWFEDFNGEDDPFSLEPFKEGDEVVEIFVNDNPDAMNNGWYYYLRSSIDEWIEQPGAKWNPADSTLKNINSNTRGQIRKTLILRHKPEENRKLTDYQVSDGLNLARRNITDIQPILESRGLFTDEVADKFQSMYDDLRVELEAIESKNPSREARHAYVKFSERLSKYVRELQGLSSDEDEGSGRKRKYKGKGKQIDKYADEFDEGEKDFITHEPFEAGTEIVELKEAPAPNGSNKNTKWYYMTKSSYEAYKAHPISEWHPARSVVKNPLTGKQLKFSREFTLLDRPAGSGRRKYYKK